MRKDQRRYARPDDFRQMPFGSRDVEGAIGGLDQAERERSPLGLEGVEHVEALLTWESFM